jgi:hypothetical protein
MWNVGLRWINILRIVLWILRDLLFRHVDLLRLSILLFRFVIVICPTMAAWLYYRLYRQRLLVHWWLMSHVVLRHQIVISTIHRNYPSSILHLMVLLRSRHKCRTRCQWVLLLIMLLSRIFINHHHLRRILHRINILIRIILLLNKRRTNLFKWRITNRLRFIRGIRILSILCISLLQLRISVLIIISLFFKLH